jgi:lysyl-tRNA synthetase class 1
MSEAQTKEFHWADVLAQKIIDANPDKNHFVLASGITPSGTIHFGKFREIITTDLVARALMRKGKTVRFIYSWDDYDTFRKVPVDMPEQEMLKAHMYQPIVDVPDPYHEAESYAKYNELTLERNAPLLGVDYVEYIYQNQKYRGKDYNDLIIHVMDNRDKVQEILQRFKTNEIGEGWQPLLTYCSQCNRDRISFGAYDKENKTIEYDCKSCGHKEVLNLRESNRLKLPWRIDWPMRWAYENVNYEPGGADHESAGSSRDTGNLLAKEVFDIKPPLYSRYDIIRVKGQTKKMSSSSGNGFSLESVMQVYEPEILRWFFASYKPESPFDIAFDTDVIKNYEAFDRLERSAYGFEEMNDERRAVNKRIYELSQINVNGEIPTELPFQPSFRHLTNVLQIYGLDMDKTRKFYDSEIKNERDEKRFQERASRAKFWIENYAPDDFKFMLNKSYRADIELSASEAAMISDLKEALENRWDELSNDKSLQNFISELLTKHNLNTGVYRKIYQLLISRDLGSKLGTLIHAAGREKILKLL